MTRYPRDGESTKLETCPGGGPMIGTKAKKAGSILMVGIFGMLGMGLAIVRRCLKALS